MSCLKGQGGLTSVMSDKRVGGLLGRKMHVLGGTFGVCIVLFKIIKTSIQNCYIHLTQN